MNHQHMKAALIAVTGLAFAAPALAQQSPATTTFQVTATVADSCTVTAADLNFGAYDPNAGDLDGTSTITATCTAGTPYDIGLDRGNNNANASGTTRAMAGTGGEYLSYELYQEATHSTVWGNTVGSDALNVPSAAGGATAHTVYGRIPAGQFVPAANYADTINVTITF